MRTVRHTTETDKAYTQPVKKDKDLFMKATKELIRAFCFATSAMREQYNRAQREVRNAMKMWQEARKETSDIKVELHQSRYDYRKLQEKCLELEASNLELKASIVSLNELNKPSQEGGIAENDE